MHFEWENNFEFEILYRGKDYADSGMVEELEITEDYIKALVRGSEYYVVRISIDGNAIEEMYCSCPYAAKGYACKHMAAVLFLAYDGKHFLSESSENSNERGRKFEVMDECTIPEKLLQETTKEELIEFVMELAHGDKEIANLINIRFAKEILVGDIKKLEQEVENIFSQNADRDGFINYYNAFDFQCEIEDFLNEKVQGLIDKAWYMEAIKLSTYVFERIGNCEIDDDGGISAISSDCYGLWKKVVNACDESERQRVKEWFETLRENGTIVDYLEDVIEEFLNDEFATEEDLKERIKNIDHQIDIARDSRSCPGAYSMNRGYHSLLDERMGLMKKIGASDMEIEDYRRSNWEFDEVRSYYAKLAEASNNYEEAIAIYKESRAYEKDTYVVHEYNEHIIEAYHSLGDDENERKERIKDFHDMGGTGLENFRKIKKLCKRDEWPALRAKLISFVKTGGSKCVILAEEKLLGRLFECLMEENDIALLNKYGFLLKEDYSDQILSKYASYVEGLAEVACNRRRYEELSDYLRRMQNYQNGGEMVSTLVRKWMEMYPTRKVMMKMLLIFA